MTHRQFIADIRASHRLLSSDAQLNDRSILAEGRSTALLLVKRETDKRRLWQSPNLFTPLPCLLMEPVPLAECCDYVSDRQVARSVQRLPRVAEGLFGLMVQSVNSVERIQKKFKETTPERYGNILKLGLPVVENYYWVLHNHLYVTSPDIEAVSFAGLFEEDVPNSLLFPPDCPCNPRLTVKNKCQSWLDQNFPAPGYLVDQVKQMVSKKLLDSYFRLPSDETQDGVDGQTKTT